MSLNYDCMQILLSQGSKGNMYKVGTGEFGTIAGKVYLYASSDKEMDGCWVYCKGKLYLRRASEEIGLVSIICPHTFKKLGTLKLCCDEAFKEPATLKFNKSMPLLTDGDNLFAVTMQVKTVKRKLRHEKQGEYEKLKKDEEEAKRKEADKGKLPPPKKPISKDMKKEDKKQQAQLSDTAKICEFHLVEFDVDSQKEESDKILDPKYESLIEELYLSFSGYFTKKECAYALRINKNDMQNAAHWLVDEGENERGKVVVLAKGSVLLAQSIVKPGLDIDVLEDSILFPYNVTNGLWTMTKSQITLHSSFPQAKVFSTNPSLVKPLPSLKRGQKKEESETLPPFLRKFAQTMMYGVDEDAIMAEQSQTDSFFEDIELKGSFIASTQMEYLQYDHTAIAYDGLAHKFYVLFLANSTIGVALEYGNISSINLSTLPKAIAEKLKTPGFEDPTCSLIHQLFVFLKESHGHKYCLPWRWDQWDTLYSKLSDRLCLSVPPQKSNDPAWKKTNSKLMRLRQRFEKFRESQEKLWIEQFSLKRLQIAQQIPIKSSKSIPVPRHREVPYILQEGRALPPPDLASSFPRYSYRGARPFIRNVYDYGEDYILPEPLPPTKYYDAPGKKYMQGKAKPDQGLFEYLPSDEQKEEKEEIGKKTQVVKENKKMYLFCCTGSVFALKTIFENIKRLSDDKTKHEILLWFYDNLLTCIGQIGVLAPAPQMGYTETLEELANYLLVTIQNQDKVDPEVLSYSWRILINGWSCLIRTTEKQSLVFQEAMKSEIPRTYLPTLSKSYYEVMYSPASSPMTLFCMKHCQYPSSFFLDYPLRQTNVQVFDVFEVYPETDSGERKGKGKPKATRPQLRFTENIQGKIEGSNTIIEMCCEKEIWPKLSGLLLRSTEEIENAMMSATGLTLDEVISFYSSVKVDKDITMPDSELQKHKQELVHKLRGQHNERVKQNWSMIINELLKNSCGSSLIWKAFNKMLVLAAEEVSAKGPEMIEFAIKCLSLLDTLLSKFEELMQSQTKETLIEWTDNFLEHLFWVSTLLHIGQGYSWETEYAAKIMPKLMALLNRLNELTAATGDSARLLIASSSFSENVDFSYEKTFETPHPYGRGEFAMKEYAHFPYAIAISCELDPRCHTENSNDYLHIFTNEAQQTLYPGVGTTLRLSGKPAGRDKYILVGNKAMIEFRVISQPRKKEDLACRWGYKITLRPIYGDPLSALSKKDTSEQKLKQILKVNLPGRQLVQILTATNNFVALASRFISSLTKGIDLVPEEANCRDLFSLPIMKEGLKNKRPPSLTFNQPQEVSSVELAKSKVIETKKEYRFKREVIEPHILRAINCVESNTGWIPAIIHKMRVLVPIPNQYLIELKRSSFEKIYKEKWALAERYVALALIYHLRCEITNEGAQVTEAELQKIGQSVNNVIQWMLGQLMGEKDYYVLRVSVLEECSQYYAKYKEKKLEEIQKKKAEEIKKPEKKEMPRKKPKKKGVSVAKTGPSNRKKVKFEKPVVPVKDEPKEEPLAEDVQKTLEDIKLSELPPAERKEFKQKLYQQIFDTFLQRYQGNFDLVKGLCNVLAIEYTAKDPAEALKKIFKKLQESLKDIIDLSDPNSFPEKVEPSQLQAKSPYEIVADHVIERARFLFECKRLEKKPGIPAVQKPEEGHHPLLPPLDLQRSASLQPFLQDAKTPEEMQRAVDSYLKWKRAKIAMDEELMNSDSPLKAVVTVITEPIDPYTLRKCMRLQQKRGLLRALGLGYQYELMQKFNNTMFKRLIIGNASESLLYGPFTYIEGSGAQVTGPITSYSLKLCGAIVESLREDCGKFKEIKRAVKKMATKNPDNKGMDENCICEHMKRLLLVFADLAVLLRGATDNGLIINLCTSSTTKALSEFLSSIVDIILMSQSYSAELQSNAPIAKLNSYLVSSCQVILNRFLISAQEISAAEAKSSIQQLLLKIFVDTLRRECGLSRPIKDAFLKFESPFYQLRITQLLSFLYEILLIFEKITAIDPPLLQKCASLLCYLLHISPAPCIVRLASKCAQLLYKFIDVDSIPTNGVIPLPAIISDSAIAGSFASRNNVVAHTLKRMGQVVMMRNCAPSSGSSSKVTAPEYYVIISLNSNETDSTFVLTALYHWENLHPTFTECYPQTPPADPASQKDADFPSMFANTRFMQQATSSKSAPKVYSIAMLQFEKLYEEVIKMSYEEIKPEDSETEKMRKLMEKNYNRRIRQHIQDAKFLTAYLLTRSFVQFPVSLPYERALELCDIIDKSYNKQLDPIPINPFMKAECKSKKTSLGTTIETSFPLTYRKMQKAPTQTSPPPPIIIAKAQLVLSLCESTTFEKIEPYLDALSSHVIQNRHKSTLEGAGLEAIQSPIIVGASFSLTLHELIQLLRSMLVSGAAQSWSQYITAYLTKTLELLATQKWIEFSEEDKEIICGCLVLVGGWSKCVRPGTQVEATVNNSKAICTVVAGGYGTGKQSVTVIVKGDDSFVTHKIPLSQVKPFEEYNWPEGVALSEDLIIRAFLNCHQQCLESQKSLLTDQLQSHMVKLIRVLILKMSAGRNWGQNGEVSEHMDKFMDALAELSKESNAESIKANCEEKLLEAWERLLENEDKSSKVFYVPKRRPKEAHKKEDVVVGKKGESKPFFEYVQPMSSYLKSLPGKLSDAHASEEAALKLLNYWEKHLIPKIQDFVRSSYKPWEFLYYFEQLRDRLRRGDINKAMEEALEMCDRRLPSGCVPPDENQDWSAFITEECIVGTWAKAKVQLKKGTQSSHPLVSRLIKQKITELTVLIKLADWRNQVALCEYTDLDSMHTYPMVFPINSLKELESPLSPPPSSCGTRELLESFVTHQKSLAINCAFKTLVSLWASTPTLMPKFKQVSVPEILHWIVMDELSEDRVEGWLKLAAPLIELEGLVYRKEMKPGIKKQLIERTLRSINQSPTEGNNKKNLKTIEALMENSVHSGNLAEISMLHSWCLSAWKQLSEELSENRISLNLTDASDVYQRADAVGTIELTKGKDGNIIFPLHQGVAPKSDVGAMVISFEINAFLSPNSKLRFYSDPQGLNTVHQINVGKTNIQSIPPIVINDGKVWCHFHQGTIANLTLNVQEKTLPSSLPCSVYFIPAKWSTACWLTESLTTAMLGMLDLKAVDNYYKPLISAICECVSKSNAPSILKQLSFMLINRILRKMRFIYNSNPYVPGSCIEKLGLNLEWLKSLIEELNKLRDNEDVGAESLYSEYIQNGAELICSALLPFKSEAGMEEPLDIKLTEQMKIPSWLRSVLSVGIFLSYFRGEGQMTKELQQTIFSSLDIAEPQRKNVVLVKSLPKAVPASKLRASIIDALAKSRARIVDPDLDILIPKEDPTSPTDSHAGVCVIFLDGFNISLERVHTREEVQAAGVAAEPEAKVEVEPEPIPLDWNCPVCTLLNPESSTHCEACGTEKPAVPVMPPEPEVNLAMQEANKAVESEDEEKDMLNELVENLKNIGLKKVTEEIKKEEPKEPPKKEEKKVEAKKEEKKSAAKKEEKAEAKKEPPKEEKKQPVPEYDFEVEVITEPLLGEMNRNLYNVLRARLADPESVEFTFSKDIITIFDSTYKKIQQLKHTNEDTIRFPKHEFLVNIGLTKEQVWNMSQEEFIQALSLLATCDPWLVWEFMALQGHDLWKIKAGYAIPKEMPSDCNVGLLEELVKLCEVDICNETKSVMRLSPVNLRFTPLDQSPTKMINGFEELRLRAKHPKVFGLNLDSIRYNWALIKAFNDNLVKAIPYINWTVCVNTIPENSIPLTISSFLSSARSLCFNYVKICLQQAVLDQTVVPRERPPKLFFERLKLAKGDKEREARRNEENVKGRLLSESVFYRAYEQVKEMDLTLLRPAKPQGSAPFLAFEIVFKGENVAGEGGPYRQFFADVSSELQPSLTSAGYTDTRSSALHLLCPTPNTKNKQGEGQDKYAFTPSAKATTDLLLYEFLGILMGCCIRTGVRLSLDLPSIIWKQIVGEPLVAADLEGVDASVLKMAQYVTRPDLSPEVFAATFTENFTALLSDETSVELISGGSDISVTYERREEYAELLLKTRLTESTPQCKAVRKGISLVVPIALLNFLTYKEVEALVCGKPAVDIPLLKRHTRYSKGLSESSERIKYFWEVLSEFNEIDKLRFIKFCWGQERLPATDEEYERRQVRFMIKPALRKGGNEEAALPKADTCFFNLELPNYKSKEVMRERLLLAIHTDDVSMNAEDNPALDQGSSGRIEIDEDQDEQPYLFTTV
eukprot:TRINITY_DN2714_c0_g1_i1.p1 TRINITY_DN2714_c0_g1~~TRINITY_DN2714_c0_g1_i1.p1  ORF type:complete len:4242 (-),score=491.35 TRINITY_DN2714_c0_g1_i1:9625-22350(-)